jgi:hypothetical protein
LRAHQCSFNAGKQEKEIKSDLGSLGMLQRRVPFWFKLTHKISSMQITEFCRKSAEPISLYKVFNATPISLRTDDRGQISAKQKHTEFAVRYTEHRLHWRKCRLVMLRT